LENESIIKVNVLKVNGLLVVLRSALKTVLEAVLDRTEKTLLSVIKNWILPETLTRSDCW